MAPGALGDRPARLALCGNVFPAESVAAARSVLATSLQALQRAWASRVRVDWKPGFGLYLAAAAIEELQADRGLRQDFLDEARACGWPIWTANAFPFGGFHGEQVKELAFLPDWRSPERLAYTVGVAEVLGELMPAGACGSLSTCPLGYGPDAREDPRSAQHLLALADELDRIAAMHDVHLTLAIEPEPDGGFERIDDLTSWLQRHAQHPRLGVCWDLCHSAVVGERAEEVLAALRKTGVAVGKVQVSAALRSGPQFGSAACALTESLAADRYFHQARWTGKGEDRAWPDLPALVAESDWAESLGLQDQSGELRVHCHVPIHSEAAVTGWLQTDWRSMIRAAYVAGCRDFEVETYTLPVLPSALLPKGTKDPCEVDLAETMADELFAAAGEIGLDTGPADP
ncbi:MAG: metabolite traffic protein EboE [Planctomycetes bacterium]|nr:metabolite traffic protein EboE [Planctomycetota bacterium]